jgi:hypothetical protein
MRGRHPSGPDYVARLDGSPLAKQRLEAILHTLGGTSTVQQACAELRLSPSRFQQLRSLALQAALARLEERPAGRPARPSAPPELLELQARVQELELQRHEALVREEVALILPVRPAAKKAPGRRPRSRRRPRQSS